MKKGPWIVKKGFTAHRLAKLMFGSFYNKQLARYRGRWYLWIGPQWIEQETENLRAAVYDFMTVVMVEDQDGEQPLRPTRYLVDNLIDALKGFALVPDYLTVPAWRDGRSSPAADRILSCENGLLDLDTKELLDSTPFFFNLASVPFAYDPNPPEPKRWLQFLDELWPDDPQSITLLQMWLGYLLSGSTAWQKILCIIGPLRSGKGVIAGVVRGLLGPQNVAGPTLDPLSEAFGLAAIIDKSVAIIPDARLRRAAPAIVERLLAISGGDALTYRHLYHDAITAVFPTRLMLLSNEIPVMPDASRALASRFLVLRTVNSFYGKEELDLDDKLAAELAAILNWSLEGLEALRAAGHFTQPHTAADTVEALEDSASPIGAFVAECCNVGPDRTVQVRSLWDLWTEWAKENGYHPGNTATFGRDLHAAFPGVQRDRHRESVPGNVPSAVPSKRVYRYRGLDLKPYITMAYPGVPRDSTSIAGRERKEKEEEKNRASPGATRDNGQVEKRFSALSERLRKTKVVEEGEVEA